MKQRKVMHENDLNRAFIVRACEDYVLKELQRVADLSYLLKKRSTMSLKNHLLKSCRSPIAYAKSRRMGSV